MLRKLITLAAAGGLAKKAYDMMKERRAEQQMLDAMAQDIKPPRKGGATRNRKRSEGPSAD